MERETIYFFCDGKVDSFYHFLQLFSSYLFRESILYLLLGSTFLGNQREYILTSGRPITLISSTFLSCQIRQNKIRNYTRHQHNVTPSTSTPLETKQNYKLYSTKTIFTSKPRISEVRTEAAIYITFSIRDDRYGDQNHERIPRLRDKDGKSTLRQ